MLNKQVTKSGHNSGTIRSFTLLPVLQTSVCCLISMCSQLVAAGNRPTPLNRVKLKMNASIIWCGNYKTIIVFDEWFWVGNQDLKDWICSIRRQKIRSKRHKISKRIVKGSFKKTEVAVCEHLPVAYSRCLMWLWKTADPVWCWIKFWASRVKQGAEREAKEGGWGNIIKRVNSFI